MPSKRVQSQMAYKSGMNYVGKFIDFLLTDSFGQMIDENDKYVPKYLPHCSTCSSKLICNGCSNCGKCG